VAGGPGLITILCGPLRKRPGCGNAERVDLHNHHIGEGNTMRQRRFVASLVALGVMSITGAASADPIETRKAIMSSVGAAAKVSGEMAKGDIPFHPDIAAAALATFAAAGKAFGTFFPEGSETGNDTAASPRIWEEPDRFAAVLVEFSSDASAARAAAPADLAAFQTAFGSVAQNCRACHEDFRISRN
jgi:cytochrome c556